MACEKWELVVPVLSKASVNVVENFCHLVVDSFCRERAISPDKFLSIWSLEELWLVRKALTDIMRKAVGKGWSRETIGKELGSLDGSFKKVICDVISVHEQALRLKLVHDTTAVSHAVLADFDWKLKLAMASDKLASLQEPLLQVDFNIREASGESKKVFLELDKLELRKLISSLEGCSKSVQQLTTNAT
uniref:COMM domain-containing protein n=1 Tax=Arion vulgaris TaxID=1028688 RepID=A0A0B6ZUD8_9EUPU